ncbi:SUKH-3 domain-containing protein [Armatimonas rosea]|uniref:Uncharacterized protein n=1 Tax=Armatimonas rosea TaxID=685828 RepID=A0A7W9SMB3_ARMRO|nr:SUKH-3 domain-containing protein [Armatimonas rosea]MBB6048970.1 hypothetical protein [Armatimonas rosea]
MNIYSVLKESGWDDGRKIEIAPFEEIFRNRKFLFFDYHKTIFESFGGLNILASKMDIDGQIRIDFRLKSYMSAEFTFLENFKTNIVSFMDSISGHNNSPLCLLNYEWTDDEVYGSDEIYINADGIVSSFSNIGVFKFGKFDEFIFKILNQLDPETILSEDELDAIFPNTGEESEASGMTEEELRKAILESDPHRFR